jgi:hypothetical protein
MESFYRSVQFSRGADIIGRLGTVEDLTNNSIGSVVLVGVGSGRTIEITRLRRDLIRCVRESEEGRLFTINGSGLGME